jgi:hypothetical protein
VVGVEDHGGYTDRTKTERDGTQENVNGSDQPESKQVKIFIAILALGRIVIGLVLFVDPNGANYKPAEHEAIQQGLGRRLAQTLLLALLFRLSDSR